MNGEGQSVDGRPVAPSWEGFAPLYDASVQPLYHVALLLCTGHGAMAEDALADAFAQCYQAWASGDVVDVRAYARQALVRNILAREGPAGTGDLVDDDPTFRQLEALPVPQRTAVVLRYYEDLSYEEIAAAMNVTVATVKAHVAAGNQHLREQSSPPR